MDYTEEFQCNYPLGGYCMFVIITAQQKGEKKGEFPVDRMRIIEKVPDATFQKLLCFQVCVHLHVSEAQSGQVDTVLQIGDENEVMYFKAKSENERKEWLETFRIGLKKRSRSSWLHYCIYDQVVLIGIF